MLGTHVIWIVAYAMNILAQLKGFYFLKYS